MKENVGGLLVGAKGYVAPPSKIIGGPPLPPLYSNIIDGILILIFHVGTIIP